MGIFQRKTRELLPPYAAYSTHLDTLVHLRQHGIPAKLRPNATLQGPLSATIFSQVIRAWRFCGLANVNEEPEELLVRLINAEGEEYQRILRGIVETSYSFLFSPGDKSVNLAEATAEEVRQRFEQEGASGSTVRRSVLFFARMAHDAGILLSEELIGEQGSMDQESFSPIGSANGNAIAKGSLTDFVDDKMSEPKQPERKNSLGQLLLALLPPFDPTWSSEGQTKWLDSFNVVTHILWDEQGSRS